MGGIRREGEEESIKREEAQEEGGEGEKKTKSQKSHLQ